MGSNRPRRLGLHGVASPALVERETHHIQGMICSMWFLIAVSGAVVVLIILHDAFETILLPRRISRQFRFARLVAQVNWSLCSTLAASMRPGKRRNTVLSHFGPLSFVILITLWALGLICGFALLHWALGTRLHAPEETIDLSLYTYMSGVIFFTLGFGDITPVDAFGRFLAVLETGIGFGFLAAVISYLPVLYQAFSHREVTIALLDARAGRRRPPHSS